MKLKAAALFAFVALTGLSPAEAQVLFAYPSDTLPPHEIVAIVRSMHLRPVTRPQRWGSTYVVRALDRNGEVVRVVVDAEEGEVLAVRHLYGWREVGRYSRFGLLAPEPDEVRPPIPPRMVPRTGRSHSEDRSASLTPPSAPLPRPRPGDVAEPAKETATPPKRPAAARSTFRDEVETTGSITPAPVEAKPAEARQPQAFPPVAPLE